MTNAKFQQQLEEMYNKYSFISKTRIKTLNELVYVLRMNGRLTGINWQLNIEKENGCTCIPGVMDSFIPVRDLAKGVTSVEFDEEIYNDFGIHLLLIETED